jgi:hypothetical protein
MVSSWIWLGIITLDTAVMALQPGRSLQGGACQPF